MSIIVSGRHELISDAVKEYTEKKLGAILNEYHKITSARVVLDVQKNRHFTEIIIYGKHLNIEAEAKSYNIYESIDDAVGKIDKQLRRFFDKVQNHHKLNKAVCGEETDSSIIDDTSILGTTETAGQ